VLHSRFRTRRGVQRRLLCKVCGRSFVPARGTVYYRLRRQRSEFDRVMALMVEGVTQAGIARSLGLCTSTLSRWLDRASRHARAFEEEHVRIDDPVELQVDELRSYGAAREERTWVFNAVEVWSRLWLGSRVGTRSLRNTLIFTRMLRARCGSVAQPVLVTTDEFKYYLPCLRRTFGPTCAYLQVDNRYARGRIVRSKASLKLGTEWKLEQARQRSEDSKRPNTAYAERLNLHVRRTCAYLHRRTPSPMRKPQRLADALDLNRLHYNFVRRHSSLRFGGDLRTPAMQAGLASRPLAFRDIFSWVPRPTARLPSPNWSVTPAPEPAWAAGDNS
jgi:hypothetical protein